MLRKIIGTTCLFLMASLVTGEVSAKDFNVKNDAQSFLFVNGSGGNVGINTTTPAAKLHVDGAIYSGSNLPTHSEVSLTTSGDAMFGGDVEIDQLLYVDGAIYGEVHGSGAYLTNLPAATPAGSTTHVQYNNSGSLAGSSSFVFDGTNVGINSTSPQAKLDVEGNVYFGSGNVGINSASPAARLDVDGTVYAHGNVGIGTAVALQPLHVNGQCVTGDTRLKRLRRRQRKDAAGKWIEEDYFEDVRIDQIRPGDEILTLDERSGVLIASRVNARMDMGVKDILAIRTVTGKTIRTTGNHPYLVAPVIAQKRVAVFIDAANFEVSLKIAGAQADYGALESGIGGKIVYRGYYGANFGDEGQGRLFTFLKHHGYRLVTKPLKVIRRRGTDPEHKGNFDVEIAWDARDIAATFDTAVLFSGDSDFVYMVEKLKKMGKQVVVISPADRTAKELKASANVFVDLARMPFVQSVLGESPEENKKGPREAHKNDLSTAVKILSDVMPFVKGGAWTKAVDINVGNMIAVVGDNGSSVFERITDIDFLPAEQVWDIEVEGTHNFVGNDIIAHNTYLTGNVGIGSSVPQAKLDVDGTVYVDGNIGIGTAMPDALLSIRQSADADAIRIFGYDDQSVNSAQIYVRSDGHLDIGATRHIILSPGTSYEVQVVGELFNLNNNGGLRINDADATHVNRSLRLGTDSDYSIGYHPSSDTLQFMDGNIINTNIRMVIASSGNVGINTTTPAAKLHVDGAIYSGPNLPTHSDVSLAASGDAMFGGDVEIDQLLYVDGAIYGEVHGSGAYLTNVAGAISGQVANYVPRATSTTELTQGTIYDNGTNIGIGSTAPQAKLDVEGNVYFGSGNVGINSASPAARLDVDGTIYTHTNIGIGTSSPRERLEVNNTAVFSSIYSNTCNGSVTIDWRLGNKQSLALTGNCTAVTFTAPGGGVGNFTLLITNGASYTLSGWPATVKWPGGNAPTVTASGTDIATFFYNGTNYYGSAGFDFQ